MSLLKYKLQRWQNLFIKDVWENINKKYKGFSIVCYEYSIVIYMKVDRKLPDYEWWFFFTQINGILAFKYRPYPIKKYIPDTVYIDDNSKLPMIIDLMSRVIDSRLCINEVKTEPVFSEITTPSQAIKNHDNIIVPQKYENEIFQKSNRLDIFERKKKNNY